VALNSAKELFDAVHRLPVNALADNHQPQQVSIQEHNISLGVGSRIFKN
jgi:hypothetical protein